MNRMGTRNERCRDENKGAITPDAHSLSMRTNEHRPFERVFAENRGARLFLQVLAFLCVSLLPVAAYSQAPLFTFAQVSDSQPSTDADQDKFERALDTIVAGGQPGALIPQPVSFVMFAGDLVDSASNPIEWTTFLNTIDTRLTANGIPYRAVPGNHDWNSSVGFTNYETYIGSAGVWETDSNIVAGHNGLTVTTGWYGLDFIGLNNSNGGDNQVSSTDLSLVDQLAGQASVRNENIFLLAHHHHDEGGFIPLAHTLNNPDVVGYMRGHSGSPHATSGLSGIQNPNVWDLNTNSIASRGGILYYEVYPSQIVVYPIQLTQNPATLPSPETISLVHPMVSAGPPVAPTANFTASPLSGRAPLTVAFTDQSPGLPTSWDWDFGDGNTSSLQSPDHTFGEGTFDVSLAVANAQGNDALVKNALITVQPAPPMGTFLAVGDAHVRSTQLTTNYGTLDQVRVRAGSTAYDGYFMFDVNGLDGAAVLSATLRLFVEDGSDDGGTVYQAANGWSELGITWGNAPGGTAIGNLGSVSSGTWVEFDVSAQVQGDGIYSFALTSNSTNSAYYSSREGVNPPELVLLLGDQLPPIAEFSADSTSGSSPHTVQFQDLSSNGPNSWLWNFGDGDTSTDQSPSHTYNSVGSYTVMLDAGNAVGSDNETKASLISVSAPIPPDADFSADTTLGPAPLMVSFSDLSTGNPTSWQWDFGDGSGSMVPNPTHQYTTPGLKTVTLVVTNTVANDQLVRSDYINVTEPPPLSTFLPVADSKVRSSKLGSNYGTEGNLRVRGGSTVYNSYLKFDVVGLGGSVQNATLRLYVNDGSDDGGTLFSVPDTSWSESGITFGNAPPFGGSLGNAGATSTGQWIEFDVTSVVAGEGQVSFGLSSSSSNSGYFDSREGAFPPELVVLTGGSVPDITVNPLSHNYGSVAVGQSGSTFVSVANNGSETLMVSSTSLIGADASEFGVAGGGVFSLAPGSSQNLQVSFSPSSGGAKSATLRVSSDDPNESVINVALSGVGTALEQDITVAPLSRDFGSIVVGQSATSQTINIMNDGSANLSVTGLSLTGPNSAEFGLGGPGSFVLTPGASQDVQVNFTPGSVGSKSASLLIASDDPDEPSVQVSLQGTGALLEPDISVTPTLHDFGSVPVTQSGSQSFVVRNDGTSALNVTSTTLTGPDAADFGVSNGGAFNLTPGASRNVQVSFNPSSEGAKSAVLELASDDPDESLIVVNLSGTGTPITAANISLEEVKTGASSGTASVSTDMALSAADGHVFLASISSKAFETVSAVNGLGLVWTELRGQCGGRSQTGVSIWTATGTPSASSSVVTAVLSSSASNAVIAVARYSGVSSLGGLTSANTNGTGGACSGGSDSSSYSVNLTTTGANSVVHAAVAMRSRIHTAGGGFAEQVLVSQGTTGGTIASMAVLDQVVGSAGVVAVAGSFSGTVDWAVAAVELKP
jgi:PKD repeat protein